MENDKSKKKEVAWAPPVLSTALAHDSTNSYTGLWGLQRTRGNAICSATKRGLK